MGVNTLEFAEKFTSELDKKLTQSAVTAMFADNAMRTKFVGAKTVIIPDVDFQGLADYDRDSGFASGSVTVANTAYTMACDRGRSFMIDREDMDETGIAGLAGQVLGEFVKTKVAPECDAYVLSKLAGVANTNSTVLDGDDYSSDEPYAALMAAINNVRKNVGYDEKLIAFVDSETYAALASSDEVTRRIEISDFKQGEVNLTVRTLDGVVIRPVVPERMKTAYTFGTDGFTPTATAKNIKIMVMPKKACSLVKKSEKMRIFSPDQNIKADAYKFDYRIYFDAFVKKSNLKNIWALIEE